MSRLNPATEVQTLVDHLFRHHASALLSLLIRRLGLKNLDLAEEVVQEAMLRALRVWPYQGIPENPRAWLAQVAHNKALDVIRRRAVFDSKCRELGHLTVTETDLLRLDDPPGDEQLAMIFACNHPSLSPERRVALTLNAACGFSVPEIARAFLVPDSTVAQRIVRAKRFIREQETALTLPSADQLPGRLDSVLQVIYLLFNEGYSAHSGDALIRQDLCGEAIWLAQHLVRQAETAEPRCHALLSLMLLQSSRLPARQDDAGDLVLLPDQDRSRWNVGLIHQGLRHLDVAAVGDDLTSYHLQAGIAAIHAVAPDHRSTDWPRLLELYTLMNQVDPSPIVSLNQAVAMAMVKGTAAGLEALDAIDASPSLKGYFLLPATRADFLRKLGRPQEAEAAYESALKSVRTKPERRFLLRRIAEIQSDRQTNGRRSFP